MVYFNRVSRTGVFVGLSLSEENKKTRICELENYYHYGGFTQITLTQKYWEYLSEILRRASFRILHRACSCVPKPSMKFSCSLEMVTEKRFSHLAHFKWKDPADIDSQSLV